MDSLDPRRPARLGPEAEAFDQGEHKIGRAAGKAPEPLAALAAERRLDVVGIIFQSGNQLPAVATGCAIPRRLRLEDDYVAAGLRDMKRRREAEIAGADNQHVGAGLAIKRLDCRRRDRGLFPQVGETAHAQ
jgi:hypothetical protein